MTLGDVYYILFRHKWKIVSCSLLGIVAVPVLYFFSPPAYQSEAKVLIRYVLDNKAISPSVNPATIDSRVKTPDERGETIINSEIEIMTSLDLAMQVADLVGAEKVLSHSRRKTDLKKAAFYIQKHLTIEVAKRSNVINLAFQHPNPEISQTVLKEIVNGYLKRHAEIHRAAGALDDFLTQQTDHLRARLSQTEQELRQARNKAGVISLNDSKKALIDLTGKIRQELYNAEAELAGLKEVASRLPPVPLVQTNAVAAAAPVPGELLGEYKSLLVRLDLLRKKQESLLTQFTDENALVKETSAQIASAEERKKKMEADCPQLALQESRLNLGFGDSQPALKTGSLDPLVSPALRAAALESKIKALKEQLNEIRAEAGGLDANDSSIVELERRKDLEEANYKYFSANLEQSRFDEALSAGKISNISVVQSPSPGDINLKRFLKTVALVIFGGILAGLAWAFLIEMVFDHSVKRPSEVESRLGMHLLLSIPDIGSEGRKHLDSAKKKQNLSLAWIRHQVLRRQSEGRWPPDPTKKNVPGGNGSKAAEAAAVTKPWSSDSSLRPFHEALRDRLVVYFDVRKLHHKPKLIALTGVSDHSGVTLTAMGLAASLSETGDGNVLLVDMHPEQEAAQNFYRGKAVCELRHALSTRDNALVRDNLYVVSHGKSDGEKLPQIFPKRFASLMPELKASDYDYILFDMPTVTQTSVTPRLAGLMDMVLMVIEAEKTDRDIIGQAHALLAESKANVCAVLNKTHNYVPDWLHQDYLREA
jgi:uncharacterized protein involved in exopolysaccharide biosynthesis/Mrp family chromosome partitioning ATPase